MFTAISQVDAYWEGLRDGRLMPDRAEIDPRGLQDNLEFALMLEHIAPGVARIRVAGSHICDLLGMEVRGMPITSLFEPTSRAKLAETLDYVVGKPCVAEIDISSPQAIGRPALTGRLYLAPLRCQFSEHRRILGCLQTQGAAGRTPRRFAVEKTHRRRIVGSVTHSEEMAPPITEPGFAEPTALFEHKPIKTETRKGHLRLVKTDEGE